ncbi:AAA family ATPase [Erwiniaceae bacterium BAC15a-03b]|uniref:AAA family ATPase n=1 Tax=Winslowiella arboricola TaxID=2978220 RepID=A0A9J6PQT6_9GAMM|nr:AAA family ATPase [Winslowiella arboricola]MCU5772891.1 AAA family ATPase [Winslowiella arboricola]MCU5780681.1 AAA family ATPase [Winslowiella arboricola]
MKINVIGTSGSGKSTLARAIARQLELPCIEMDALFWQRDWGESSDEQLFARLEQALQQPGWVLDGNYKRSQPIKWREVDTIIWVDYGFLRTLYQAVRRAVSRAWRQQEIWPDTNCRETFRKSFFSRDSIILWTIKTWRSNRQRYEAMLNDRRYQHLHFVRLTSPQMSREFIAALKK